MWPNMDMHQQGDEVGKSKDSTKDKEEKSATSAGVSERAEGEEEAKKRELAPKDDLDDLEAKVTASLSDGKEEAKRKIGKN